MATALDIVEGMFSILNIVAEETPIESSMAKNGLEILNDLGIEWELTGANLGFAPVADLADEVRIPRGAHATFKYNGAARLAPLYDVVLSGEHVAIANNSLRTMMSIYRKPLATVYPDSLPMGEASECSTYNDDNFFPTNEKENF